MARFLLLTVIVASVTVSTLSLPRLKKSELFKSIPFVPREGWGGRPARNPSPLNLPVPNVVIHHTYIPGACLTFEECAQAMRSMQDHHQIGNGWDDIGYNFAIGSDGAVYEGRGWEAVGAHAIGVNPLSIGIALIGDWVSDLPPEQQLTAAKNLIAAGVELGYISPEYQLIGHRQVTATECPGQTLFTEISTWENFTPTF